MLGLTSLYNVIVGWQIFFNSPEFYEKFENVMFWVKCLVVKSRPDIEIVSEARLAEDWGDHPARALLRPGSLTSRQYILLIALFLNRTE